MTAEEFIQSVNPFMLIISYNPHKHYGNLDNYLDIFHHDLIGTEPINKIQEARTMWEVLCYPASSNGSAQAIASTLPDALIALEADVHNRWPHIRKNQEMNKPAAKELTNQEVCARCDELLKQDLKKYRIKANEGWMED